MLLILNFWKIPCPQQPRFSSSPRSDILPTRPPLNGGGPACATGPPLSIINVTSQHCFRRSWTTVTLFFFFL
jgi:hypothetical protein